MVQFSEAGGPPASESDNHLNEIHVSKASSEDFYFSIINDQSFDVELYWINFDGLPKLYHTIQSGKTYGQHSNMNHVWVLSNETNGLCITFNLGVTNNFLKANAEVKVSDILDQKCCSYEFSSLKKLKETSKLI